MFCLLWLLLVATAHAKTLTVGLPPQPPTCAQSCFTDYYNGQSSCSRTDTACICADPYFSSSVACCMAGSCSSEDVDTTFNFLEYDCAAAGYDIPNVRDCKEAQQATVTGVATADVTFVSAGADAPTSSKTTNAHPSGPESTSSAANAWTTRDIPGTSAPTVSTTTTSSSVTSAPMATATTSSTFVLPHPAGAAPPSSKPTTNNPQSNEEPGQTDDPKPLALGLSLGLGIPLTIAALGSLSFFFYRQRKRRAAEDDDCFGGFGNASTPPWSGSHPGYYPGEWKPEMAGSVTDRYAVGQRRWGGGTMELPS